MTIILQNKSYHPTSTKKSIVYSQSLRIRRICTEDSEYMKHALNLVQSLKKRGYKEEHCLSIIKDVEKFDRKELLKPKMKHMDNKSTMAPSHITKTCPTSNLPGTTTKIS